MKTEKEQMIEVPVSILEILIRKFNDKDVSYEYERPTYKWIEKHRVKTSKIEWV